MAGRLGICGVGRCLRVYFHHYLELSRSDHACGGLDSYVLRADLGPALNKNILEPVARVVEWCEPPGKSRSTQTRDEGRTNTMLY